MLSVVDGLGNIKKKRHTILPESIITNDKRTKDPGGIRKLYLAENNNTEIILLLIIITFIFHLADIIG